MVLKLPKVMNFFHFCAVVSKKFKSILAIFVYAFESLHCVAAEKGIFYYDLLFLR